MLAMLKERIKRITLVDISLVKLSAFFFGILIVKLFPELLNINYPTLIILMLVCGVKPFHSFWLKK